MIFVCLGIINTAEEIAFATVLGVATSDPSLAMFSAGILTGAPGIRKQTDHQLPVVARRVILPKPEKLAREGGFADSPELGDDTRNDKAVGVEV